MMFNGRFLNWFLSTTVFFVSTATIADGIDPLEVTSELGAAAIAAGECDLLPGSPAIVHNTEKSYDSCVASFVCPRSSKVAQASAGTPALGSGVCPIVTEWRERNNRLAKEGKLAAFRAAEPKGGAKIGEFERLNVAGLECRLRPNRNIEAVYTQLEDGTWTNEIHAEIECRGPGSNLMPPFVACKNDGEVEVKGGGTLLRGRTIADCWKEENRFPITANHNNQIKMMSEKEFEQLVAQRKKDRKSNNGLTPSAARVAAGETATSGGKTHERGAGAEAASRRPDSVESSLAIAR